MYIKLKKYNKNLNKYHYYKIIFKRDNWEYSVKFNQFELVRLYHIILDFMQSLNEIRSNINN